jgi:hypothetical protein
VICAFPVSGQYGAGSRIVSLLRHSVRSHEAYVYAQLYYVLVITCIFARKAQWLRGACLYVQTCTNQLRDMYSRRTITCRAAALIFPAVAALHGIVLASTHVNG